MAASDEQVELLELFQLQNDEGPCLDCFSTGNAVINPDLRADTNWPRFSTESVRLGFPSVCALPMRLHGNILGCLNLFMSDPIELSQADVTLAQALADVSSVAIVQDEANRRAATRNNELQHALTSRVLIEQAKGMIAEHQSVNMHEAFTLLRTFARNNNLPRNRSQNRRRATQHRHRYTAPSSLAALTASDVVPDLVLVAETPPRGWSSSVRRKDTLSSDRVCQAADASATTTISRAIATRSRG
jgi:hypothetical protein